MVTVVAKNFARPDATEQYKELAKQLEALTNQNDAGCIQYKLYTDINEPTIFMFIEQWQDMESLKAHFEAPHFKALVPQLQALCSKPGETNLLSCD